MIVPMKKIFLLLLNSQKNEALKKLKDIGVVHLENIKGLSEKLDIIQADRDILQRSIFILPENKKKDSKIVSYEREETLEISKRIINLNDDLKSVSDVLSSTLKEIERIKIWGDFNPRDIDLLKNSGVDFKFYEFKKSDYKELPENLTIFTIAHSKTSGFYVIINDNSEALLEFDEIQIPEIGLYDLQLILKEKNTLKTKIEQEIETLSDSKPALEELLAD